MLRVTGHAAPHVAAVGTAQRQQPNVWLVHRSFLVVVFAIPVFLNHFVIGLIRYVSGGWFHMLCRAFCRFSNNECANACYYVIGGLPQVINYLITVSEMIGLFSFLIGAFWSAFGLSLLNPVCGVETCIELLRITDWTYSTIFANLPVALEHPGKLIMPCYFGDPYKSDAAKVAPEKTATPSTRRHNVEAEELLRAKFEAESNFYFVSAAKQVAKLANAICPRGT